MATLRSSHGRVPIADGDVAIADGEAAIGDGIVPIADRNVPMFGIAFCAAGKSAQDCFWKKSADGIDKRAGPT